MKSLRVLYIAAELSPLTGDGPRARENHYLPRALAELGVNVTVALPGHAVSDPSRLGLARRLSPLSIPGDAGPREVIVYEGSSAGGRVNMLVLDWASDTQAGGDPDGAAFCRAALDLARARDWWPDVVMAGHGTEPALALAKAATQPSGDGPPATVFLLRSLEEDAPVREALAHADRIVVASSSWAEALLQRIEENPKSRAPGVKLLAAMRDRVRGVTAGVDSIAWNPRRDSTLAAVFSRDPQAGKAQHKQELVAELGLRARGGSPPLIAVLGPLDPNIITFGVANSLAQCNAHLAVLAHAERDAASLRHLQRLLHQSPTRVAIRTFDDAGPHHAFERRLLAAADFALIAHEFSPAVLNELYCTRYGVVPIAPNTGSFADDVVEFDALTATGSGFLFAPGDSEQLLAAVHRALHAHHKQEGFAVLMNRVMSLDLSWKTAAQRYVNILVDLLEERRRLAA
jgi:starch synthase